MPCKCLFCIAVCMLNRHIENATIDRLKFSPLVQISHSTLAELLQSFLWPSRWGPVMGTEPSLQTPQFSYPWIFKALEFVTCFTLQSYNVQLPQSEEGQPLSHEISVKHLKSRAWNPHWIQGCDSFHLFAGRRPSLQRNFLFEVLEEHSRTSHFSTKRPMKN